MRYKLMDRSGLRVSELGSPHDFLRLDFVRQLIHGESFPLIDRHRPLPR